MTDTAERPPCRYCGTALRAYSHAWFDRSEIPANATITSTKPAGMGGKEWGRYRLPGQYGVNGHSLFCSQYHGYKWAEAQIGAA